jgi:hypothetical protein
MILPYPVFAQRMKHMLVQHFYSRTMSIYLANTDVETAAPRLNYPTLRATATEFIPALTGQRRLIMQRECIVESPAFRSVKQSDSGSAAPPEPTRDNLSQQGGILHGISPPTLKAMAPFYGQIEGIEKMLAIENRGGDSIESTYVGHY